MGLSLNPYVGQSNVLSFGFCFGSFCSPLAKSTFSFVTSGGRFRSLFDFCARVDRTRINRRVVEALVKAGAFDAVGSILVVARKTCTGSCAPATPDRAPG